MMARGEGGCGRSAHGGCRGWQGWLVLAALLLACSPAPTEGAAPRSLAGGGGLPSARGATAAPTADPAVSPASAVPRQVKVAYPSASLSQMAFMYAEEQGIYARHGVEVESVVMTTAPAVAALVNGDVQYVYSGSTLLLSAARGLPVRTFFQGARAPTLQLFARPEIASFADLRGKTVSVLSAGGLSREVTELVIEKHGVDPKAVRYIASGSAPAQMEHLRQGLAVAATISPPWPLVARREGYRLLANIGQEITYPFALFATTTGRLAEAREEVKALVRATLETHRLLRAAPAEVIDWIQRRFEVDPEVAAESYALALEVQNDDGEVLREGVANYFRIQTEQPHLRDVRYEDVVDMQPLQEVWRELGRR